MRFIDDKGKKLNWHNRNYFYAGTIFLVLLNVILFATLGNRWNFDLYNENVQWTEFSVTNIFTIMFAALSHASWSHVCGNIIGLAVVGLYLERKMGTFNFLFLHILLMFIAPAMTSHVKGNIHHHGYSGVNFATYAFLIIDFFFSLKKEKRNWTNIILGILAFIYIYVFSMSWAGGAFIDVTYYPKNLIENIGHYTGFLAGILVGLFYQWHKPQYDAEPKDDKPKS